MLASIWLQPVAEHREQLRELIAALAAEHGTVPFEPHLTVCGGADLDPARWDGAADWLRHHRPLPIRARRTGISYSTEVSFRAMVIDVENTPDMRSFRDEISRRTGAAIIAAPHISLLYSLDERGQRVGWAADEVRLRAIAAECTARLAATEFSLDDPVVVAPDGEWANVGSWRVVRHLT